MMIDERKFKIDKLAKFCDAFDNCDAGCPVKYDHESYDLCQSFTFLRMTDGQLDRLLKCFEKNIQPSEENGKVQRHKAICNGIHVLYEKKNHDYGDSFGQSFRDYGLLAGLIRMEDKFNRLKTLARGAGQEVVDESITDTLRDLANYAIMTLLEMEG